MKLLISRNRKAEKSFFGGHKGMTFILSYRVELTPQESELIAKYKAENGVLTRSGDDNIMTISDIVKGRQRNSIMLAYLSTTKKPSRKRARILSFY